MKSVYSKNIVFFREIDLNQCSYGRKSFAYYLYEPLFCVDYILTSINNRRRAISRTIIYRLICISWGLFEKPGRAAPGALSWTNKTVKLFFVLFR